MHMLMGHFTNILLHFGQIFSTKKQLSIGMTLAVAREAIGIFANSPNIKRTKNKLVKASMPPFSG